MSGLLFFTTQEPGTDARVVYVNSDGTGQTILVNNVPTVDLVTYYPAEVALDTAAGFYFAVSNAGITGDNAYLLRGSLGSAAAPTVVVDFPDAIIVNTIQLDAINHKIYATYQDGTGGNGNITGIRVYSYDPLTGALTDNGFLTTAVTDNRPNESGFFVLDPRDFALDASIGRLFYTEKLDGLVEGLYRLDLANPNVATQLVSQAQFPDSGANGYFYDVEVDTTTDLVYFTTQSQYPFPDAGYSTSESALWYISEHADNGTATQVTLTGMPGGLHFYPGDMTFDQSTRRLYIESGDSSLGAGASNAAIYVFQLDAPGTSAALVNTITLVPQFFQDYGTFGGLTFAQLASLGALDGTASTILEQGAIPTNLLMAAPTITDDGGYLKSATVQITGGTFVSNESSFNDDTLGYGTGMVQSGTIAGTSIVVSWNQATGSLTFTGYDTFAHYAAALANVHFLSSGNNPTNYGLNTTRTLTWTVNDGTLANPAGSQSSGTTTITIAGVNDAPTTTGLSGNAATWADGSGAVALDLGGNATLADVDSANFGGGTLTVHIANVATGVDQLGLSAVSGVTFTATTVSVGGVQIATYAGGGAGGGDLVFSFDPDATPAAVQALIRAVTYDNSGGAAAVGGTRNVAWTLVDGDGTAGGGADTLVVNSTVQVTAVDDAPVQDGLPSMLLTGEDVPIALNGGIAIDPPPAWISDIDSASVTTTLSAVDGAFSVTGSGTAVVTGNGTESVTITGTPADVNLAVYHASYTPPANVSGTRTITVSTSDGSSSDSDTITVTIAAVSDTPEGSDVTRSATEDTAYVLSVADFGFSDIDGDSLAAIVLADAPTHGRIVDIGGYPVEIDITGDGVPDVFTTANPRDLGAGDTIALDLLAGGYIRYVPVADANGAAADSFRYQVVDDGGAPVVAIDPTPNTMTFDIAAVDDPATAQNDAVTTNEATAIVGGSVFANNGSGADTDIDNALTVTEVNGVGASVGTQITLASGALLTVNAGGTFDYDPNGAFDGTPVVPSGAANTPATDSFTYTLAGGSSATVTITITGLDSDDLMLGTAGNDVLVADGGADELRGLGGDDLYYVNAGDTVVEAVGEGTDRIFANASHTMGAGVHVERLTTGNNAAVTAINLTGNELANLIYGNAGANVLDGGTGADALVGFGGDDWFYVDSAGDVVAEGAGGGTADRILASVSYQQGAGVQVERLTTDNDAGTAAINLTGNELANQIDGNAGANVLDGRGGADTLVGLGGDDWYFVDNAADAVSEGAAEGAADRVFAGVSYALTAGAFVERLTTDNNAGTGAIDLTGNELANLIYGNAGVNLLDGSAGDDTLVGGLGNDTMVGGLGDDHFYVDGTGDTVIETAGQGTDRVSSGVSYVLAAGVHVELLTTDNNAGTGAINLTGNELANIIYGNAGANVLDGKGGNDVLIGDAGQDSFAFTTALGAGNVDAISGFSVADDTIRLEDGVFTGLAAGALAAGAFNTGAAATQLDDRIIYNSATGALLFDVDGLGGAAAVQFASLSTGLALTASDFLVI